MSSTNKTELGLNNWIAEDKPTRVDFNSDNEIITDKILGLTERGTWSPAAPFISTVYGATWSRTGNVFSASASVQISPYSGASPNDVAVITGLPFKCAGAYGGVVFHFGPAYGSTVSGMVAKDSKDIKLTINGNYTTNLSLNKSDQLVFTITMEV